MDNPVSKSTRLKKDIIEEEFFKEPITITTPATQKVTTLQRNIDNDNLRKVSNQQNPIYHIQTSEKFPHMSNAVQSSLSNTNFFWTPPPKFLDHQEPPPNEPMSTNRHLSSQIAMGDYSLRAHTTEPTSIQKPSPSLSTETMNNKRHLTSQFSLEEERPNITSKENQSLSLSTVSQQAMSIGASLRSAGVQLQTANVNSTINTRPNSTQHKR